MNHFNAILWLFSPDNIIYVFSCLVYNDISQDRRQFGPAPNKLLSDVANMETSLNIEMKGTGRDNSAWKRISQAQQSVEMSLRYEGDYILYLAYLWYPSFDIVQNLRCIGK